MKARVVFSPRAQADIDHIWNYTAKRWNKEQAETYIRQLFAHIKNVAAKPGLAKPCPEVREGYYKYHAGSHYLFFRRIKGGIDIVRILHERMNYEEHFGG